MSSTPILQLPMLLPSQAQKHVTYNQALLVLDAIVQAAVLSRSVVAPPADPADGDRYIIGVAAEGDWSGRDGQISVRQDGTWFYLTPGPGWLVFAEDENCMVLWTGSAWEHLVGGADRPLDMLGISATPDAGNRLVVASAASLFSHDGDSHRLKVNKAAPADTSSVLFQTAYAGRAEIGLAGTDHLQVRVSEEGVTWITALQIDNATGRVALPATPTREVLDADRSYFVRVDGDDANTGLADGVEGAFATIQRAVDAAASIDLAAFSVSVHVGAGTYSDPVFLKSYIGAGPVRLVGAPANPEDVLIDVTGDCFSADGVIGRYELDGFKLRGSDRCIYANAGSVCVFENIQFDGAGTHLYARALGTIQSPDGASYEITATAFDRHAYANLPGASVTAYANTITLPSGGAALAAEFAQCKRAAAINFAGCTFVNKLGATGRRFVVKENGILITGGGPSDLPGDVAGEQSLGGVLA